MALLECGADKMKFDNKEIEFLIQHDPFTTDGDAPNIWSLLCAAFDAIERSSKSS